MKTIKVENAVGTVLAHDITRIVPGKFKGVGFKKGHIVRKKDIPELLKLGKKSLYVMTLNENQLHEDDAALRIARAVSDRSLRWTKPSEGKSGIVSKSAGLFKVDTHGLLKLNKIGNIIISTLKNNLTVEGNQTIAATRIIPLVISKKKIERLEQIAEKHYPLLQVLPFKKMKVGAVVTGSEVFQGLVKDEFDQYIGKKFIGFGSTVVQKKLVPDDDALIADAISQLKKNGCELIVTTGGLSVDPDDVTRKGIKMSGAKIVMYGTPILPGAMFLYAKYDDVPVLGLPACVFFHTFTVFDIILPRILVGDDISRDEIAAMGHGGLCMNCQDCRYPVCTFGK